MSFQAAWLRYSPDGAVAADGMVVTTPDEVGDLVAKLADDGTDTATIYLSDSGVFATPPTIDHTVHVAVAGGYGYLSHWDMANDLAFARGGPTSVAHLSEAEDFPAGSGLTIPQLTAALVELLATGKRPTSVDWVQ
jgi:Immunity protein Imm1